MRDDESPADMGDKFFQQWRRSSGHNRNMLRDNMKFIGIGCVARPGGYFETVYATQIFWREAHGGSTESPPAPVTVPPPPATQTEQDDEEELETPKQMPEEMPKEQPEMPEEQSEEMPEHKPKDMDDKNYNDYSFSSDDESVSSGNDAMMSPDGTDSNGNYMMEDKKERRRRRRHYRHRHSNIPKETETPQLMPDDSDSDEKRPFWFNWWGHDGNSDEGEKSDSHSSDDSDNGHRWYFSWFW